MFDLNKIIEIAEEVGVEVNSQPVESESGLYFRNKNGNLEKWDAISEFGQSKENPQDAQHFSNYFEKKFYTNQISKSMKTVYKTTNKLKDDFASEYNTVKQPIILEAA